jgi:CRISPR-associated protein Cmr1
VGNIGGEVMDRKIPEYKDEYKVPDELPEREGYITQIREYELITPLFGGGVEPSECDELTPVRGTEIRGHLRFWWRATRGGHFDSDLPKMKEKEDEIWGAASLADKPSPSSVTIKMIQVDAPLNGGGEDDENLDRPFKVVRGKNWQAKVEPSASSDTPAYLAFPLQPTAEEAEEMLPRKALTKPVRLNINFTLAITFKEIHCTEVKAALWAWETFGGLGARTRRGFGALRLKRVIEKDKEQPLDLPQTTAVVTKWIQQKFTDFDVKGKWPANVPHLPALNRFKVTKGETQNTTRTEGAASEKTRAIGVWKYLAEKYQSFRQSRYNKKAWEAGIDRDDRFGLSRWPEAEEIRSRLKITSRNPAMKGINKFPRAKLGLPIIFHLLHDEEEVELSGTTSNRRASPLIFRPLVCADEKAVGLALVLVPESLPPDNLQITRNKTAVAGDPIEVEPGADLYKIHPLHREKDIFKAFLETLK